MVIYVLVINFLIVAASYFYKPDPVVGLAAIALGVALFGWLGFAYRSERKSHAKEQSLLLAVVTDRYHCLKIPFPARDGDCVLASEVTEAIAEVGWRCETITIAGCNIDDAIVWMHEATCVTLVNGETRIVDLTATQYDPNLPAVWIVPFDDYLHRLTSVTRVFRVWRI